MPFRRALRNYKIGLVEGAVDLADPEARSRARTHFLIFDHGFLRTVWTNFAEVAPGVYRANQPSPRQLERYAARGIRTIVNLRGPSREPHYLFEEEACARLGLTLVDAPNFSARAAPEAADLLALIDTLRQVEKPFLMHCKSGADRTSLAAAAYLLAIEGRDLKAARAQFSPRYIHFRWTKTGVLDHILDHYERAHETTGIGFEAWLRSGYDASAVQASFDGGRR